ncbi:hypothetical protein SNE40_008979 [Patella caerulea]|uniref:BZIP domain-containing protein n=1 Tax=Patella caerulea TaxID=87958 RepID=A0AAN8Q2F8_PATCE
MSCVFSDLLMNNNLDTTMTNNMMSQNNMEEKDMLNAAKKCMETGDMIPILKQEIKYSIKFRRFTEGKEELQIEPPVEKKMELTEHEIEKKKRRREQNRLAALRFRQKNKNKGNTLMKDINKLQAEHDYLTRLHSELLAERESLVNRLKEHFQICAFRPVDTDLQMLFSRL